MGTPAIAATVLERLASAHDVVGVFTRPDAVSGRGGKALPSAVKAAAAKLGIPVVETASFKSEEMQQRVRSFSPDAICVVAYGALLPKAVLDIPRFGCLNVHASLLPRWRGAAPIERAILAGDAETGVCIMRMDEGLDTGDFCVRREVAIGGKTQARLTEELARVGAQALLEALDAIATGAATWTKQNEAAATYAAKIGKGELDIDPNDAASTIARKVQAASEAHACHVSIDGKRLLLLEAGIASDDAAAGVASELSAGDAVFKFKRLLIAASDGLVEIKRVKPEGKKEMDAKAFCAGIQGVKTKVMKWERVQ